MIFGSRYGSETDKYKGKYEYDNVATVPSTLSLVWRQWVCVRVGQVFLLAVAGGSWRGAFRGNDVSVAGRGSLSVDHHTLPSTGEETTSGTILTPIFNPSALYCRVITAHTDCSRIHIETVKTALDCAAFTILLLPFQPRL